MAGWIGLRRNVLFVLSTVKADRDENGNYLIFGEPIIIGLDLNEVVVPAGTMYSVAGERRFLAALLNETSYGTAVTVIS